MLSKISINEKEPAFVGFNPLNNEKKVKGDKNESPFGSGEGVSTQAALQKRISAGGAEEKNEQFNLSGGQENILKNVES